MSPDVCTIYEQIRKTYNKSRTCTLCQLHSRNVGLAKEKSTVEIHVETLKAPNDEHVCFGWSCNYYRSFWWVNPWSWNFSGVSLYNDGSRISQMGTSTPEFGAKTVWKWKKLDRKCTFFAPPRISQSYVNLCYFHPLRKCICICQTNFEKLY